MRKGVLPRDERCMAVVTHHDRITTWHLCQNRRKHEVVVVTEPRSHYFRSGFVPVEKTVHVCGVHKRRLVDGEQVNIHNGEWRGHFKNEPVDDPVTLKGEPV